MIPDKKIRHNSTQISDIARTYIEIELMTKSKIVETFPSIKIVALGSAPRSLRRNETISESSFFTAKSKTEPEIVLSAIAAPETELFFTKPLILKFTLARIVFT